ncbi:tRNA-splicing endonuclease subunit [Exophiala xenobiotica]|uniref:tRNA-splicing endonuclease subunit Sen34 n=1 Tax=Vermiconidia calcicola TaxID=1690605 RepID=A0AAV9QBJ5_9PEZI|nr:tRNA-splicing endonuclease subunit [Exophiala xenobiotica]KAK5537973.1 tRNA-splicing endonuclease subunit [Chaetothyriales sp. CCFEE 6169]KAK5539571.1 tRNA-splicing endonuclease subunit [Vermiconidia calcicola]KAK5210666.1 tRNA-splicing endonuclease subunit [Exophiala xenobiotica]KAK5237121.1 tRNA-splicing endonuclease subunit [Exophiala xenobiotica]
MSLKFDLDLPRWTTPAAMESPRDLGFDLQPDLPVPISQVGGRYLLFDIKIATYLRREHRICGTQTGTLPLAPSQNLFLGVPIEIMPEEAQLLVEKGVGFIFDEARAHDEAMLQSSDKARRADYLASIHKQSKQVEQVRIEEKEQSRKRALRKRAAKLSAAGTSTPSRQDKPVADLLDFDDDGAPSTVVPTESSSTLDETASLQSESTTKGRVSNPTSSNYHVTPATSQSLLPPSPPQTPKSVIRDVPASYPMYKHLHENGFFMTPGLRFGCQYTVYPGDPLRFHSHFLAVGVEWDEPIELMDVVGGGRLGTGVKKGFLLGGASPAGDVRTFSIEWAAM